MVKRTSIKEKVKRIIKPEPQLRLVAERNIAKMEALGWKKIDIKKVTKDHDRILGVRTHASDLTLMQK